MNGLHLSHIGDLVVDSSAAAGSSAAADSSAAAVSLSMKNHKMFGRVMISCPLLTLQVDTVLPKKEWKIDAAEAGMYSHVNLEFVSIDLSQDATGILGGTQKKEFTIKEVGGWIDRSKWRQRLRVLCCVVLCCVALRCVALCCVCAAASSSAGRRGAVPSRRASLALVDDRPFFFSQETPRSA